MVNSDDKSDSFDNDNNDDDITTSNSPRRSNSGSNKNVNLFGFNVPSDTVNLVLGALGLIGTVGTGIMLYDKYNQNKVNQEAQQKKEQEAEALIEYYKNLQNQETQQNQIQQQANNSAYLKNDLFSNNADYIQALNKELDNSNSSNSEIYGGNNQISTQQPAPQQQQPPLINVGKYQQYEEIKKQKKDINGQQPLIDTSLYLDSQSPDSTSYF